MNTSLWVKFQINVSNRLFIVNWKAEKMISPRKVNADHISVTNREGHLWLLSHAPYPQPLILSNVPWKVWEKSLGLHKILLSFLPGNTAGPRLSGSLAFWWSVELSYDWWYVSRNSRLPQGGQANLPWNPAPWGRVQNLHGNLGDDRTTRLNSSVSLNHSIGRPPFKCPTPYSLSREYTFL